MAEDVHLIQVFSRKPKQSANLGKEQFWSNGKDILKKMKAQREKKFIVVPIME